MIEKVRKIRIVRLKFERLRVREDCKRHMRMEESKISEIGEKREKHREEDKIERWMAEQGKNKREKRASMWRETVLIIKRGKLTFKKKKFERWVKEKIRREHQNDNRER